VSQFGCGTEARDNGHSPAGGRLRLVCHHRLMNNELLLSCLMFHCGRAPTNFRRRLVRRKDASTTVTKENRVTIRDGWFAADGRHMIDITTCAVGTAGSVDGGATREESVRSNMVGRHMSQRPMSGSSVL
jgi:hypothetical protein